MKAHPCFLETAESLKQISDEELLPKKTLRGHVSSPSQHGTHLWACIQLAARKVGKLKASNWTLQPNLYCIYQTICLQWIGGGGNLSPRIVGLSKRIRKKDLKFAHAIGQSDVIYVKNSKQNKQTSKQKISS